MPIDARDDLRTPGAMALIATPRAASWRMLVLALLTALAACMALSSSAAALTITEFSDGITPGSQPIKITTGPDGNIWFTEYAGRIGRITPAGVITEFSDGITPGRIPAGITTGPDDNLWFVEIDSPGAVGRITTSGAITEFDTGGIWPNSGIVTGPDDNLWFTGSVDLGAGDESRGAVIARMTTSGTITTFSTGLSANSSPQAITNGPDGNLWFTDGASRIGRITPQGTITQFTAGHQHEQRAAQHHARPRRQPLVHRVRGLPHRAHHAGRRRHAVPHRHHGQQPAERDRRGPRRQPLVHRVRAATRSDASRPRA